MAPKSGLSASDKDFEIRGNDRRSFLKLAVGTVVGTASMPSSGFEDRLLTRPPSFRPTVC
jgi:hypothetical protein